MMWHTQGGARRAQVALCPIHASAVRRHLGCRFTFSFSFFLFPIFFPFWGGVLKWLSGQFMRLPFEDVLVILTQLHTQEDIACYVFVLILLCMCPNTAICVYVPSYCYTCVLILPLYVLILLHMCPRTAGNPDTTAHAGRHRRGPSLWSHRLHTRVGWAFQRGSQDRELETAALKLWENIANRHAIRFFRERERKEGFLMARDPWL